MGECGEPDRGAVADGDGGGVAEGVVMFLGMGPRMKTMLPRMKLISPRQKRVRVVVMCVYRRVVICER